MVLRWVLSGTAGQGDALGIETDPPSAGADAPRALGDAPQGECAHEWGTTHEWASWARAASLGAGLSGSEQTLRHDEGIGAGAGPAQ
jgi:hypothetical protein